MRFSREVPVQGTISYLFGVLIFSSRFFCFTLHKILQADWFGAEFLSLFAGRLLAAVDAFIDLRDDALFPSIIPILPSDRLAVQHERRFDFKPLAKSGIQGQMWNRQ